jgi:formylmethanofuran dehydrogenase subunit D
MEDKDKPEQQVEYRKIQAGVGDYSLSFVLPKKIANDLGIGKGDYVKVSQQHGGILIQKA